MKTLSLLTTLPPAGTSSSMLWMRSRELTRPDNPGCRSPTLGSGSEAGAFFELKRRSINQNSNAHREHHHEGIKEIVKPFDWSYSTDYKGTTSHNAPFFQPSSKQIPVELLKRPDPIKFFDEVMLYEDELADNGITMLSCKIRVMPDRLLLLSRFFMRLDGVVFRIRDTRVYVDFHTQEVVREYVSKEERYETVRQKLVVSREDIPAVMRDANRLSELVPVVERDIDAVILV